MMKRVRWQMWAMVSLMAFSLGCEREEVEEMEQAVASAEVSGEAEESERADDEAEGFDGEMVAFPSNDWECSEERAEQIGDWIEAHRMGDADRAPMPMETVEGLLEGEGLLPERPPLLVQVRGLELEVEGRSTTEAEELAQRIDEIYAQRVEEGGILNEEVEGLSLALAIGEGTPGDRVEAVVRALKDAADVEPQEFYLAFRAPAPRERAQGIPEALQTRMMEEYPSVQPEEPEELAVPVEMPASQLELLESCPPLAEMMEGMEAKAPDARMPTLAEDIPEIWLDCECEIDIEYLLATFFWEPPVDDSRVGHITYRATTLDALLEALASQGDRPWSELKSQVDYR